MREHGTQRGYRQHRYYGDLACRRCVAADNARKLSAARARRRALEDLRDRHQAEFRVLLNRQRAAEGLPATSR